MGRAYEPWDLDEDLRPFKIIGGVTALMIVIAMALWMPGCTANAQNWGPRYQRAVGPCGPLCQCGCNQGYICRCRVVEPAAEESVEKRDKAENFGLIQEKLNGTEKASVDGQPCCPQDAVKAIEGSVPDFHKRHRVVIIDQDEARRQQIHKELATLPECADCIVQAYSPDHWHLKDLKTKQVGFFTAGSPTIYLLAADGKVLHRQDEYQGGSTATAEAFRRARANYDPTKDPDRRRPSPAPTPTPGPIPPAPAPLALPPLWLAVLAAAVFFFFRRRNP